ncbi:CBASS cGAMP-activated phospholipase [Acinetobacter sp. PW68]|uniref:CBASS cGAMP-activated phospholipase n=1 Tax=Acinetobacter sp. PW68 TaxID=2865162 RepID=UPI001E419161|nr:CBASS cGAMP-activated phospholipase [Acinetobacter sp. PW68]MCD0187752.1 cGAMP-activated phospholipase CapV [Acinetobacter sp. PW68]
MTTFQQSEPQSVSPRDNSEKIKVLSLNGGGVRGLFTISLLAQLEIIIEKREKRTGVKIGDYFDLITGTSIGGILALGLASGKSARELQETFEKSAPHIFPARRFRLKKWITPFYPIYKSDPLYETVKSMIGDTITFDDLKRRVMITSLNLSTGKPKFFKTPHNPMFTLDGEIKLIDAAMATSAAPTYFKPHFISKLNHYFADGGLVSNNPSFIGIREVLIDMKNDFPNAEPKDVKILNIGTLSENYCIGPKTLSQNCSKGYLGLWGMGERLVLSTMTANQHLQRFMLLRELKVLGISNNYIEIDETIPNEASSDITLDNASQSSLNALKGMGEKLGAERYSEIKELREFFLRTAKPFVKSNNNGVAA